MDFSKITENSFEQAINLLKINNLPTEDIDANVELFGIFEDEKLIATAGLEKYESIGLLRSVSTTPEVRGKGFGKIITAETENYALQNGISEMYLLTTTAKDFFAKDGYTLVNREDVPEEIKQTKQFSSVCPSSATIMKKDL
ncbi:MAG: arsenic resistance N-acetyltransferase ArsN2 [Spirosomataceae bacterium]